MVGWIWTDCFEQCFGMARHWRHLLCNRAVTVLNRYKNIHSVKPYGTYPLDASKAMTLIEGAELMRDYPGWTAEDQQAFKDFLVYPGYTTKEDYFSFLNSAYFLQTSRINVR